MFWSTNVLVNKVSCKVNFKMCLQHASQTVGQQKWWLSYVAHQIDGNRKCSRRCSYTRDQLLHVSHSRCLLSPTAVCNVWAYVLYNASVRFRTIIHKYSMTLVMRCLCYGAGDMSHYVRRVQACLKSAPILSNRCYIVNKHLTCMSNMCAHVWWLGCQSNTYYL